MLRAWLNKAGVFRLTIFGYGAQCLIDAPDLHANIELLRLDQLNDLIIIGIPKLKSMGPELVSAI